MSEIVLGCLVIDIVTGQEGIVTGHAKYLNGCEHYSIQPKAKEDGSVDGNRWVDREQVIYSGVGVVGMVPARPTGGPQSTPTSMHP